MKKYCGAEWSWNLILTVLIVLKSVLGLDVVKLQDYCGYSITRDGGSVEFKAEDFPYYIHGNECIVRITGQMTSSSSAQIMFYFTKFDLSSDACKHSNLTITDWTGQDHIAGSFAPTNIEGLPSFMCGHNASLEEDGRFFTTRSDELTLTYRREPGYDSERDGFVMKFVTFHTDKCSSTDDSLCPNQHCIPKKYHCSTDLKSCGAPEDPSCSPSEAVSFWETFVDTVKNIAWVIVAVIAIAILRFIYIRNKDKFLSILQCICGRKKQTTQRQVTMMAVPENDDHAENEFIPLRRASAASDILPSFTNHNPQPEPFLTETSYFDSVSGTSYQLGVVDTPAGVDVGDSIIGVHPGGANVTPTAPPPSYEEVTAPSYEECMLNKDKYTIN